MCVRARALACEELILLAGLQRGFVDFRDLVSQKIKLPCESLGIFREAFLFRCELHPLAAAGAILGPQRLRSGEGIENQHLLVSGKKALVVVRAVQVDQQIPKLPQERQRARRAVDELLARSGRRDRAFDHQGTILAGFRASLLEHGMHTRVTGDLKKTLHRAGIGSRADERLLRPLAEQQFHRAEDDGFSSAGLAGNGDKARGRLPEEILYEGQIADAKRCQRCGHSSTMPPSAWNSKRCKRCKSHF